MQKDRARIQTEKILKNSEKKVSRVYKSDPALLKIQKEYDDYMDMVSERTESLFKAFKNEKDINILKDKKKAYMDAVMHYTIYSKEYKALVKKFTKVMAQVNQKALNITNNDMAEVYAIGYNAVADECRKAGIKVGRR